MSLLPQIEERQSIRVYQDREIPENVLMQIMEAGRRAPSAKNRQTWRFIVITDESKKKRLQTAGFGQEHIGSARAVIAGCTTNIDYTMPNGQNSYPIDIGIAMGFMMIQAQAEGLGSCFVSMFDELEVKEILSVPYSMRVVLLLTLGYPAEKPFPSQRKQLKSIISYNHW